MTTTHRLATIAIAAATAHMTAAYFFRQQRRRYAGNRRHILVVQGGTELRPTAEEIDDLVVSVMMGGVVLDLRQTTLKQRPAHVDLLAVMGGVVLVVPDDWTVRLEVEPTMGGTRDGRTGRAEGDRPVDLVVSGRVVMGGLDVASELPGERWRRAKLEARSQKLERKAQVSRIGRGTAGPATS
jgi:hypothetical protein